MTRLHRPHLLVFSCLMAVGFASLFAAANVPAERLLARVLDHLGAALLVVGGIGVYERAVTYRELVRLMSDLFHVGTSCTRAGLDAIADDPQRFDFEPLITESKRLTMVFNDGHKWVSSHFASLARRFHLDGQVTELFLVDPDGEFLPSLAKKTGDTAERLREKIGKSIASIRETFEASPSIGTLRVYHLPPHLFPTQTIFLGDDRAVFTLYTTTSSRAPVPVFCVSRNENSDSIFAFLKNDTDRLRESSTVMYDSGQQSP